MLIVSEQVLARMAAGRVEQLMPRIAAWLPDELPGWRAAPDTPAWRDLRELLKVGLDAGMSMESDFALFALVMFASGDWRALIAAPDVQDMLRAPQIDAPSKLMWLEDRVAG